MTTKTARARVPRTIGDDIDVLGTIYRRLFRQRLAAQTWVQDAGLRPPCFGALSWIDRLQPVTQKQVSTQLGLDPSDMVDVVDILERAGYVTRRRDPGDRRRYALEVTDAGRAALARLRRLARRVDDELLAPLDATSRAGLRLLLEPLIAHHLRHHDVTAS